MLGSSDDDDDDDEYDSDDLSYESTESERYLEKLEFEEDVLGKIESNDPVLTKLTIHRFLRAIANSQIMTGVASVRP